jgi:hypothetical protein
MRYIVAVVIAVLSLSTPSYGQNRTFSIHSWGLHSCGKYLAAVHGHAPGTGMGFNDRQRGQFSDDHIVYMAWLGGFFSAVNVFAMDEPNQIQSDNAAIWCCPRLTGHPARWLEPE